MWRSKFRELVNRKEETEQRKWTQKQIAEATDIRQPTISAWMRYGATFSYLESGVAGKLARFIGCDPLDLVEFVSDERVPADTA